MAWPQGDPIVEIDGLIDRHREDMAAWQHQHEEAIEAERRAEAALEQARALKTRCDLAVELDRIEIDRLLEERAVYLPQQRTEA